LAVGEGRVGSEARFPARIWGEKQAIFLVAIPVEACRRAVFRRSFGRMTRGMASDPHQSPWAFDKNEARIGNVDAQRELVR
jgi:hypothetical protein